MRSLVLLFLPVFLILSNINAQVVGGKYEKLAKLYNAGKYESCLFKADNFTYKEDYSKDAEPYLYISMCFYQLSLSEDPLIKEDYKNGLSQAIKYAAKFVRKDKDGEMYEDNIEYINMLKTEQRRIIKKDFKELNYRKTTSNTKLYGKLKREEDFVLLYYIGMGEILSNNLSQGTRNISEAETKIEDAINTNSLKIDNDIKSLVVDMILKYSEYLVTEKRLDEAKKNLDIGLKIYPNDGYLKMQYNLVTSNLKETVKEKTEKSE